MLDRFLSMPPDMQQQFIARMKDRGMDTTQFEAALKPKASPAPPSTPRAASPSTPARLPQRVPEAQPAQTIDALFAPLPPVETRGRVWLFINNALKPVNVRLGVSDGTNTELLSGELQENLEVVTGVTGVGNVRPQLGVGGGGNPLLGPQRGPVIFPGPGPGGGGGGRGPGG
jgi:hypothetical protein